MFPDRISMTISIAFHPGAELRGHSNAVEMMRFSPNGRRLYSASKDETILEWDVARGAACGRCGPRGHTPDWTSPARRVSAMGSAPRSARLALLRVHRGAGYERCTQLWRPEHPLILSATKRLRSKP